MLFELKNVSKTYGKKENTFTALDNVTFDVKQGSTLAIVGKSGSGKSTLMHIMATLDSPTSGNIIYNSQNLNKFSKKDLDMLRNREFGFVFQQFFLNANQTVLENIALPLKLAGVGAKERKTRAKSVLKMLDMSDKANSKAADLSGGQKQRACVARALITGPKVIFADEPTGNLDTENGKMVIDALFDLNKDKKITLIIVTHDNELAAKCGHQIRIKDGKIEATK